MTDAVYGGLVLEHFRRPRNQRRLESPTASEEAFNPLCGDRVRVDVALSGDHIEAAAFTANACAVCTASASLLTERVTRMTIEEALAISDAAVVDALGARLPNGRIACATLPLRALHAALSQLPET